MEAKEKAKEITNNIWKIVEDEMPAKRHIAEVKQLGVLMVDEVIKYAKRWGDMAVDDIKEFEEIKTEINNLTI